MKHILPVAALIATLPTLANAGYCNTCTIQFTADGPTWTDSGISTSGGRNLYTTQGRLPTAASTYTGVCETSCYGTTYTDVYTCPPGAYTRTNGVSGYIISTTYGGTAYATSSGIYCYACPYGSYSGAYGQASCTLCPAGYYTTGSGAHSCSTYKCSGYNYTETWATPAWSDSTQKSVSNVCVATKCTAGAYLNGTKCTPCAAGTYNPTAGATSADACLPCPSPTNIYTDQSLTTLATPTSDAGSTSCYIATGTYYDETGQFEITDNCPL